LPEIEVNITYGYSVDHGMIRTVDVLAGAALAKEIATKETKREVKTNMVMKGRMSRPKNSMGCYISDAPPL